MRSRSLAVVLAVAVAASAETQPTSQLTTRPAAATTRAARTDLGDRPLVIAAQNAQLAGVKQLLAGRVDEDELWWALHASLRDALDAYNGRGIASPYIDDDKEADPVGLDVARDLTAVTQRLIDAGADVNLRVGESGPVLRRAARDGTPEQVTLLLNAGADINARGEDGRNALAEAVYARRMEIVRQLLDAGAAVRLPDDPRDPNAGSLNLPHDDPGLLRLLLERGADASGYRVITADGREHKVLGPGGLALVAAAREENAEVVAILIDHGVRDPDLLFQAASAMFQSTAEQRLSDKSPPRDRAAVGARRRSKLLTLLLDEGLDPNAPDGSGMLLLASIGDGHSEAMLRERGGRIDRDRMLAVMLKNIDEATRQTVAAVPESERYAVLYSQATIYPQPAVIRALREAGAPMPIGAAAMIGDIDRVREILEADPSLANRYPGGNGGFGPLRMAALNGHLEVCKLLIDAGAEMMPSELSSRGWGGMTPLEGAAANGHVEVVKLLLERGARVDVSNLTDTNTQLITHLESYIHGQRKEEVGRRLLGMIEVLPLLKAATQSTTAPSQK